MDQAAFEQALALNRQFNEVRAAIEQLNPSPECFLIFAAEEEPIFEIYDNF